MKMIEKCCREICVQKEIDPDQLVSPFMPTFINAAPLINGFYIPPVGTFCKAWQLFEHYVKIVLTVMEEPTEKMIEDGEEVDSSAPDVWEAMIKSAMGN
jgi:hypothetical protein